MFKIKRYIFAVNLYMPARGYNGQRVLCNNQMIVGPSKNELPMKYFTSPHHSIYTIYVVNNIPISIENEDCYVDVIGKLLASK